MSSMWFSTSVYVACAFTIAAPVACCVCMRRQVRTTASERWRERRIREELEAYAMLDIPRTSGVASGVLRSGPARLLAGRVCRTIAEKSAFTRVAMLLRNGEGRFTCAGSVGFDDLTTAALLAWSEKVVDEERAARTGSAAERRQLKCFSIALGEWEEFDPEVGTWQQTGREERRRFRRALIAPIGQGRMLGLIAVCGDGAALEWLTAVSAGGGLERAMGPIQTLTARLASAIENEAMSERLLRAEKLAGLGQLAGGVAHALNNPLTAVIGFAELIVETADESRVRKDAATIMSEALKMKETVQRLVEFWRPAATADESVDVMEMLRELSAACTPTLKQRGVSLTVAGGAGARPVRGSRHRLRQMMEHLLNNAAQAIAEARSQHEGEEHAIRIAVSFDERVLHLLLSDTGPGFHEPGRVFDPFYTTKEPTEGAAGLGLSICYGIVREHGGEISAFNLHPHGAAIVVELPLRTTVVEEEEASGVLLAEKSSA